MNKINHKRRAERIRRKLKSVSANRFRLSVYRSSKNISAQIIDDKSQKTLISFSSLDNKSTDKLKKSDLSDRMATLMAKKAIEKKISKVYFDRGRYKYHGRIKIFAEALRKNGLTF